MLLLPFFPAALQDIDIGQTGLFPQPLRHFVTHVAGLPAAIDHHFALRRPGGEHATKQIIPSIFVQLDGAWNMTAFKRLITARVDPKHAIPPGFRLRETHRRGVDRRLRPGSGVAIENGLPDRRNKGQPKEQKELTA
jgi:hypothetical protein